MPSSANASSRSRKYHSWGMWFHLKESRWTPTSERGLGLETVNICVRGMKFPWVGGMLAKVHFELF
jgi:hypothetical protein